MRDCPDGAMRDQLPLFVSGGLGAPEQARVAAHVASCADCSAEVELLRVVARAFPAPNLNVAKIAAKLPSRRAAPVQAPFQRRLLWRVAASLTLFIAGTATVMLVRGRQPIGPSGVISQQGAQQGVQQGVQQAAATRESTLALGPGRAGGAQARSSNLLTLGNDLSDLTDAQLESLLGSLDGLDPRPQADPMTIATPIIPDRSQAPGRSNQ